MFPENTRILIVEDMETTRDLLKSALRQLGFLEINEAKSGVEALRLLEKASGQGKPVGLVLSDINMDEMDGLTFLGCVRSSGTYGSTPVIMVTAEGDPEVVVRAISLGANNYIIKPFTAEGIRSKLTNVWERLNRKKNA